MADKLRTARRRFHAALDWWHLYLLGWVNEPKKLTYWTCAAYAILTVFTGLSSFLSPPSSLAHQMGPYVTMAWGGLILGGGTLAIAGCLPGWWWLERTGITCLMSGLGIYASVVLLMHSTSDGNRLPQLGAILACVVFLSIRWLRVRGAFADPRGGDASAELHPPVAR